MFLYFSVDDGPLECNLPRRKKEGAHGQLSGATMRGGGATFLARLVGHVPFGGNENSLEIGLTRDSPGIACTCSFVQGAALDVE